MHGHELPTSRIAIAAAAIAGTVFGAVAVVLLWLHARQMPPGGLQLAQPYTLAVPGPALDSAPQPELAAYRAAKAQRLHGRGWVDASKGIVHIPIDDAMALLVARAAPAASAAEAQP